jgi:hypothetical protein
VEVVLSKLMLPTATFDHRSAGEGWEPTGWMDEFLVDYYAEIHPNQPKPRLQQRHCFALSERAGLFAVCPRKLVRMPASRASLSVCTPSPFQWLDGRTVDEAIDVELVAVIEHANVCHPTPRRR